MSTALAIAGVTAVLRDLLNDGLINHNISGLLGSTVKVSVMPPDRVIPSGGTEASQLNLFLHQVTPNAGWRNEGLPAMDSTGRNNLGNQPLALNLHYLLTAYTSADLHGEILLGYAMQLLHENPVITRQALRDALDPSPDVGTILPPALRALSDCGLAGQAEQLRITPEYLSPDEMSKIWTSTQVHYRSSTAYQVTVVLIESDKPRRAPLPVLSRGPVDPATHRERGVLVTPHLLPPFPMLEKVQPDGEQPAIHLGKTVDLVGHNLNGTGRQIRLVNERFSSDETLSASGASTAELMQFAVPIADTANFPVGDYKVSARVISPGETDPQVSNRLALVLAPEITNLPLNVVRDGSGTASFTLDFRPRLRQDQSVSLLLGTREIPPEPHATPTGTLDFAIEDAAAGDHLARLRIDGIDSPIIDYSATPPVFFNHRINIT